MTPSRKPFRCCPTSRGMSTSIDVLRFGSKAFAGSRQGLKNNEKLDEYIEEVHVFKKIAAPWLCNALFVQVVLRIHVWNHIMDRPKLPNAPVFQ